LVRPGVILIAPLEEFNTYLHHSALFIMDVGYDDAFEDGNEVVIRGVLLDTPTPFTLGEMVPADSGVLSNRLLFRGGNRGGDAVLLLHSVKSLASSQEIGHVGIYQGGGLQQAMEACQKGLATTSQFKFFFNYYEFSAPELEEMLATTVDGDDAWQSVEADDPSLVLRDWDRGECWRYLRNVLTQRFHGGSCSETDNGEE
jgi:hypothetical protein